jgi:hypothetical protein
MHEIGELKSERRGGEAGMAGIVSRMRNQAHGGGHAVTAISMFGAWARYLVTHLYAQILNGQRNADDASATKRPSIAHVRKSPVRLR